jgi:hypothetical protein
MSTEHLKDHRHGFGFVVLTAAAQRHTIVLKESWEIQTS